MRISKEYDERRNEILDTAERLFHLKGYENCTVNDIIKEVSIAKGTFYHYFKSKQEVLDAVVARFTDTVINRVQQIIDLDSIRPEEKLMRAFMSMRMEDIIDDSMLEEMHKVDNALLHQKTLNQMVTVMAPSLTKIIEEGMEKKVWKCKYPLSYMRIFLAAALTLTDEGIFQLEADSQMELMVGLISMLEKLLEVPENTFMIMFQESQEG